MEIGSPAVIIYDQGLQEGSRAKENKSTFVFLV